MSDETNTLIGSLCEQLGAATKRADRSEADRDASAREAEKAVAERDAYKLFIDDQARRINPHVGWSVSLDALSELENGITNILNQIAVAVEHRNKAEAGEVAMREVLVIEHLDGGRIKPEAGCPTCEFLKDHPGASLLADMDKMMVMLECQRIAIDAMMPMKRYEELLAEHLSGNLKWGGDNPAAHDDAHTRHDWEGMIYEKLRKAPQGASGMWCRRMLQIANLAMSGIWSDRRKRKAFASPLLASAKEEASDGKEE